MRFKAEINVDGREITRMYLSKMDLEALLKVSCRQLWYSVCVCVCTSVGGYVGACIHVCTCVCRSRAHMCVLCIRVSPSVHRCGRVVLVCA